MTPLGEPPIRETHLTIDTFRPPGLEVREHHIQVPLDYSDAQGRQIDLFARELREIKKTDESLPYLVYLQGGPGFESPRPAALPGWIEHALSEYAVVLLDQRGTGLSSPVSMTSLAVEGAVEHQAHYLSHFRADNIVRDAEQLRTHLIGNQKWTVLGQSFGGFCAVRYLTAAPQGLEAVMITGGLPPLSGHADEVYQATYRRVLRRNRRYFERYPTDRDVIDGILECLHRGDVHLPNGTRLTPEVFQQVGMALGASDGFERIHYLLRDAFVMGVHGRELSYRFLDGVQSMLPFDANPIYALLHESIYCQGTASDWSAHRVRSQYPEFDIGHSGDFHFVGEMVYPWMFEEYQRLRPLQAVAQTLAQKSDWPHLYDSSVLRNNRVPCAAAVYDDDMYVERQFSSETADAIAGMKVWVTNEYDHNGLRADGPRIVQHLQDLIAGVKA